MKGGQMLRSIPSFDGKNQCDCPVMIRAAIPAAISEVTAEVTAGVTGTRIPMESSHRKKPPRGLEPLT